jgi:RNA polymerase sigma-70 factor (ECF subfamily)
MTDQDAPLAARFLCHLPNAPPACTMIEFNETQLIAAAQGGDAEAYGWLVRKYQDRLCATLQRICPSAADAQDTAQEAFLRAYLKLDTFTGNSAFYSWLYRIAFNVAISEHRRRRVHRAFQRSVAPCVHCERSDERMLRAERAAQVQQALHGLSPEHRTILELRELEDCDYDEIASILAVPLGTVRSRLHRARLQLRERLDSLGS